MNFQETTLAGAYVIELDRHDDERGFFARSFCQDEFAAHGLSTCVAQCNISFNRKRGTLRGMHFQFAPKSEAKLVRCTRGAIHDVVIDLRPDSATYCSWFGVELTGENRTALYVPEGFAHGFQTLENDSEVFYQMFEFFSREQAGGVRWNDPAFDIAWPLPEPILSEKDRSYPDFLRRA